MTNEHPNQMTIEEKMNEFLENQKEMLKQQHLNNLLLIAQNHEMPINIREAAQFEAFGVLVGVKLASDELKGIALTDLNRIKERIEIDKAIEAGASDSELARQFK